MVGPTIDSIGHVGTGLVSGGGLMGGGLMRGFLPRLNPPSPSRSTPNRFFKTEWVVGVKMATILRVGMGDTTTLLLIGRGGLLVLVGEEIKQTRKRGDHDNDGVR